jgi:GT2 family glycosyltransferase/2-polyprenyl-3-methyl-5-hydroxy-6-metoxy-1,4-benzoquinol methylase
VHAEDALSSERYLNESALDPAPDTSWGKLLALVPQGARVLDVGCGHGAFASALTRLRGCHVTGIEVEARFAEDARARCEAVVVGDVATVLREGRVAPAFDVVVASDVLEHLVDPAGVLRHLSALLRPGGALIASVPNVTHLSVVAALAGGRFPRTPEGLLDATHVQFYGEADLLQLFAGAGFAARVADRVRVDPRHTELHTDLARLPAAVLEWLERNPEASTYQFIVRAVPEAWAADGDREPPRAPAPAPRIEGTLASEVQQLHERLGTYHELATSKDRELAALQEKVRDYHEAVLARDAALLVARERRSPARARLRAAPPAVAARLRVLYVADREDAPFRYRCLHGCEQLREAGAVANVHRLDDPTLLDVIPRYSVVVLFRLAWSERVAAVVEAARASGARVAFEVDDLVFDPAAEPLLAFLPGLGPAALAEYRRTFAGLARTFEAADFCIVSTETLAAHARARGKDAVVHPNLLSRAHVELSRFVAPARRLLQRRPIVGYLSGSNTHDADLASIAEALVAALRERPELGLLLVGHVDPPQALRELAGRVAHVPYLDHRLYPWLIARCRAVLAPIATLNDFTHAKSALKIFEAGAFGVPAVASPTAPYAAAIEHGVTGFLAATPAEWRDVICALADRSTSARMGDAARAVALEEHSPEAWHGVLAQLLLERAGKAAGRAPALVPHDPVDPSSLVHRARVQARLARAAVRLAWPSAPGAPLAAAAHAAADAVRELAASARAGQRLAGPVRGAVLADRERGVDGELAPDTHLFRRGHGARVSIGSVGPDPQVHWTSVPVDDEVDELILEVRTDAQAGAPALQLFWREEGDRSFSEDRSVRVMLPAGGWQRLAVPLPRHKPRAGRRWTFRLDPLDRPGTLEVGALALAARGTPASPPADVRRRIAARFLRGRGLEIGALQNPLPLPDGAQARYVDRLTRAQARAHYPELQAQPLVDPTVICDADRLALVPDGSEDFVVCNHVLEHMRDPLGALREWLRVLKPGGHLYVSVPDGRNPLDAGRSVTPFDHLLADAASPRPEEDRAHFEDWTRSVHHALPGEQQAAMAADLQARGYSIHYHVFDRALFERVLEHGASVIGADLVELVENPFPDLTEYVAVLRRRGEPVRARPVDVVVPVYNARDFTRRCAESVLRHGTGDFRLVLVDDASPDPGIAEDLAAMARRDPRVVVLTNPANRGFVATANRGMAHAAGRDVLLLNSDTEVFEGFLDRLRAAIDQDPRTAVVSPFSNNATICSIPQFARDNAIPDGYTPERFARLVAATSRRARPELPTAVGFCMWIRAEALAELGTFDEATFGRGYGEENDLCQRARKAGWKVRLCDDVFVYHKGKASFGEEGKDLEANAGARRLEAKHPGYHAEIARFVEANPLAPLHDAIRFHLPRLRPGAERAVLHLVHASPWAERAGGTEHHVKDLLRVMRLPRAAVAWPEMDGIRVAEVLDGDVDAPRPFAFPAAAAGEVASERALEVALRRAVELLGVRAAHVHHLLRWPSGVTAALDDAGVPFVWTHHDYYAACLDWNLFDFERDAPCACTPDRAEACLSAFAQATGAVPVQDLPRQRERHRAAMDRAVASAQAHVFPSAAARAILERQVPAVAARAVVIGHGYDADVRGERPPSGPRLRLALVGEIAHRIKGSDAYVALAEAARDLPVEWHVFGDAEKLGFGDRFRALGLGERLVLHGPYARHELPSLLREHGIDLCLLLPAWHETFSYVLSEALLAGVPALVSDRGALGERMRAIGAGRVVDSVAEAARVVAELCRDRAPLATWSGRASAHRHRTVADSGADHRHLYERLGFLVDEPLEPADAPALLALHGALAPAPRGARPMAPVQVRTNGVEGGSLVQTLKDVVLARPRLASAARIVFAGARALPGVGTPGLGVPRRGWHNVALLRRTPWSVALEALNPDPQLHLATGPLDAAQVRAVRFLLRHELPEGAYAQLFWTHDEREPFSELNSVQLPLGAGDGRWHRYVLRLDGPEVRQRWRAAPRVVKLRLDPTSVPGRFELGRIDLERS